jgi:hypothetical protein
MQVEICPMNAAFVWRLGEMPWNGTIVVVAHGSQPLRWAYLPDGATRLDVESAFTQGYRLYNKSAACQATIMHEGKMIDHWRFTVEPAAMRSYQKALTAGIQMQEESVNLWKELLSKLGSPEEFQAKLESMRADAFPQARKRMEEFVETFNRTSNQTIDLFQKTVGVYQATSLTDAQRRMQDLIESSLTTLRVNVHSALNTNAKIIGDWKDLVDRFGPPVK